MVSTVSTVSIVVSRDLRHWKVTAHQKSQHHRQN